MHTIPKRTPDFTTDAEGAPVALVPLANGGWATLDLIDWEALLSRGISPHWTFNASGQGTAYVRCQLGPNLATLARLITGAKPSQIVTYRNGDRRDLRRGNLLVRRGGRSKAR